MVSWFNFKAKEDSKKVSDKVKSEFMRERGEKITHDDIYRRGLKEMARELDKENQRLVSELEREKRKEERDFMEIF